MVNIGYQQEDRNIIDYQLFKIDGIDSHIRGPERELVPGEYAVAIGAAQTFGRFSESAYPDLLSDKIGFPVINLGFSGAGPSFFCKGRSS